MLIINVIAANKSFLTLLCFTTVKFVQIKIKKVLTFVSNLTKKKFQQSLTSYTNRLLVELKVAVNIAFQLSDGFFL